MSTAWEERVVSLETGLPFWDRFFTVAPLVVVGTREGEGFDLAPKHMAGPMSWEGYFGFVCTRTHATYDNVREHGAFTVSYPRPSDLLITSLTAAPRCEGEKPVLHSLATIPSKVVDGVFLEDSYLFIECELDRIVEDLGPNSLILGRVVATHVDRSAVRESERDDGELIVSAPLLVYVDPGRYAVVEHTHPFPFPAGYSR